MLYQLVMKTLFRLWAFLRIKKIDDRSVKIIDGDIVTCRIASLFSARCSMVIAPMGPHFISTDREVTNASRLG